MAQARSRRPCRSPSLDPRRLAAIDLPGGGIAAAALTAAYLAAERGEVTADDVARRDALGAGQDRPHRRRALSRRPVERGGSTGVQTAVRTRLIRRLVAVRERLRPIV